MGQEEGYIIVDDTSAKMEGRNILKSGYDVVVEVYRVRSRVCCWTSAVSVSLHALSKQALFVFRKIFMSFTSDVRLTLEFDD
jgi:hypothetical protein